MKSEEEQKKEALEYLYSKRMALRAEYLGTNALLVKKGKPPEADCWKCLGVGVDEDD